MPDTTLGIRPLSRKEVGVTLKAIQCYHQDINPGRVTLQLLFLVTVLYYIATIHYVMMLKSLFIISFNAFFIPARRTFMI